MTTMNREMYEALISVGADKKQAADAAESVPVKSDIATKSDLKDTELRLVRWMILFAGLIIAAGKFL